VDPIERRDAARAQGRLDAARAVTFRQCASAYIEAKRAGWKNAKHRQQWQNTLDSYAHPIIGDLPIGTIDTPVILDVLRPIWTTKPDTAKRLRGRIEAVLSFAMAAGYRNPGLNPARWQGHLDQTLARPSDIRDVEHHAALPYAVMPAFMTDLRAQDGVAAKAFEFTILSAARTGETIGARWAEINLKDKTWTVPADRMKGGRLHIVPLSDRAVTILDSVKPADQSSGAFVFPGRQSNKPLSNMAFLMLLRRMGRDDLTAHGFRSTFADWAGDCTGVDQQTREFALAHGVSDKTEAAYRRGTAIEKRRVLMRTWSDYCTKKPPAGV